MILNIYYSLKSWIIKFILFFLDFDETTNQEEKLEQQRVKQKELIAKLKEQLEDLESYAYETGEMPIPSSMLLERQSVVIEQLKGKLPQFNLDELDKLTPEELRKKVDKAVRDVSWEFILNFLLNFYQIFQNLIIFWTFKHLNLLIFVIFAQ